MINNDILRMFRYAMDINDSKMVSIFGLAGEKVTEDRIRAILKKEDEEGHEVLDDHLMEAFLNGLIVHERGDRSNTKGAPGSSSSSHEYLTNNIILKKMRIALNFKEDDMVAVFKLADKDVSKPMLSALFRKEGHKNYKECGDQFLRNFLKGLALRYRS